MQTKLGQYHAYSRCLYAPIELRYSLCILVKLGASNELHGINWLGGQVLCWHSDPDIANASVLVALAHADISLNL